MFDVNPNSVIGVERKTSVNFTALPGEARDALFAITPYFDLNSDEAQGIWDCVIDGVFSWRAVAQAKSHGVPEHELRRFSDVFGAHL